MRDQTALLMNRYIDSEIMHTGSMQQNYEPLRYKVFVVESKHPNVSLQSIMNNAVVRQTDIKGRGPSSYQMIEYKK